MRDMIRKYLGLQDIASQVERMQNAHSQMFQSLGKHVDTIYDNQAQMRALIVEKFDQTRPASIEALDAIFKETRDRLDIVMTVLDGFRETMGRRY